MNRKYTTMPVLADDEKQKSDSLKTSNAVYAAINETARQGFRSFNHIWETPTLLEYETVNRILNEWCVYGDIPAGKYYWGNRSLDVYDVWDI